MFDMHYICIIYELVVLVKESTTHQSAFIIKLFRNIHSKRIALHNECIIQLVVIIIYRIKSLAFKIEIMNMYQSSIIIIDTLMMYSAIGLITVYVRTLYDFIDICTL